MTASPSLLGCLAGCFRPSSSPPSSSSSKSSKAGRRRSGTGSGSAAGCSAEILDLSHCCLEHVPNDLLCHERTLETLCLDCNSLKDLPPQLFQCGELRHLSLSDNDVRSLPEALSSLAQLVHLNVSKNVLTDLPDALRQLKQLRVLDVSVNPLQKIPESCTQLLNVTELYLNDTILDFLPANFCRLVNLRILELRENTLYTLPKTLSRLTQLQRLDIGQNEMPELPEVIGSLHELSELWVDTNRIKHVPDWIGNLTKLTHFEASCNHINAVSDRIGECSIITHLFLSSNDLKSLPESVGKLTQLITLKVDDNQLESVPFTIGKMKQLEELIVCQNFLVSLPPSIGLCRRLHTLNVDDNDLEALPREVGSCSGLRILSAHGNRLTSLPAELDHIAGLSVINVTANMIQHLPVSFMKLTNISALWLSENQNKPLIQLNQDTDPETGQRVLTNFMLPQQPDNEPYVHHSSDDEDNDERQLHRKSHVVHWAGHGEPAVELDEDENPTANSGGNLRREPTPFPKEMRAMAKRVQSLRKSNGSTSFPASSNGNSKQKRAGKDSPSGSVEIRQAKVGKAHTSPVISERYIKAVYQDERSIKEQFQDLERSMNVSGPPTHEQGQLLTNRNSSAPAAPTQSRQSPDKASRDSGNISPSNDSMSMTEQQPMVEAPSSRKPSDPLPLEPQQADYKAPVKAEIVTSELNSPTPRLCPPPYHIAAAMSKRAGDFTSSRKTNSGDDTTSSVSGSEVSTAPSSLQTIVRAPFKGERDAISNGFSSLNRSGHVPIAKSKVTSLKRLPDTKPEPSGDDLHAQQLRKVSEQLLANPRTRQSVTGIPMLNASSRPGSYASPRGGGEASPLGGKLAYPQQTSRPPSQLGRAVATKSVSPPTILSPVPVLNTSLSHSTPDAYSQTNGLLTTIERAAHSDDDDDSSSVDNSDLVDAQQPNYENVSCPPPIVSSASQRVAALLEKSSAMSIPPRASPSGLVSTVQYAREKSSVNSASNTIN